MEKNLGRRGGMRLAAVILAMVLISPGVSWGQGQRPGSRVQDGPQQADKTFTQEQKKKRQQQLKNPKKKSQPAPKGKKPAKRTQPTDQPMRGGPMGPAGK